MTAYPEITEITEQVERYSPDKLATWKNAVAAWDAETCAAFCVAINKLRRTTLMEGRKAKVIGGYSGGPLPGQPILVFGEIPLGGGDFKAGTNQLIFNLNGQEYWRYPSTPGMTRRVSTLEGK